MVGYFLFGFEPVLDIAPAELRAGQAQRFAADQRDGFRFDLAQMVRSEFAVHERFGRGVSKNDVRHFVEGGFVRERGKGIDSDFTMSCKPLDIAVYFVKGRARDIQTVKCRVQVEARSRRGVAFLRLRFVPAQTNRPESGRHCDVVVLLVLPPPRLCGCSLEWHRHAKGDSDLSFAYLPFAFEPTAIGVERSWLQIASNALFERKQRIPENCNCEMRCRLRAFCPASQPLRAGAVPKWHVVFRAFLFFLVSSFFQAWFSLEKKKQALPKWSPAPSRPRCQGRAGFAFIGAQRRPLIRGAGDLAQSSRRKGSTNDTTR